LLAIDIQLGEVSHIIQLAIAPVFLLTGIGANLTVLTNRLARIIDRSRILEERISNTNQTGQLHYEPELATLYRRTHLINCAITLSTSSALCICLVIVALFLGDMLDLALAKLIASLFVLTMLTLIGSFIYLLREILIATRAVSRRHIRPPAK
jgi:hypothetical protein